MSLKEVWQCGIGGWGGEALLYPASCSCSFKLNCKLSGKHLPVLPHPHLSKIPKGFILLHLASPPFQSCHNSVPFSEHMKLGWNFPCGLSSGPIPRAAKQDAGDQMEPPAESEDHPEQYCTHLWGVYQQFEEAARRPTVWQGTPGGRAEEHAGSCGGFQVQVTYL